ncbi:MAG: cytochrome c [Porticoccaceae bacterium]
MITRFFVIAALAAAALTGCDSQRTDDDDRQEKQRAIATGEVLFQENCAACHPRSGRGDYLKRIPATLLVRRSETELMTWIRGSDKHREMPAFVDFNEDEMNSLAAFLFHEIERQGIPLPPPAP